MNITSNNPPNPHAKSKKIIYETMVTEAQLPEPVKTAMSKWLEYKKHVYQEMGFKTLLAIVQKKTEEYGAEAIAELVDECIANGWKGLIWEKLLKRSSTMPQKKQRNYDAEE